MKWTATAKNLRGAFFELNEVMLETNKWNQLEHSKSKEKRLNELQDRYIHLTNLLRSNLFSFGQINLCLNKGNSKAVGFDLENPKKIIFEKGEFKKQ
jgi:hypothetical protein